MTTTFGIYLGNTSCCIAVNKDGKAEVVANAVGDRVTPAVVSFTEREIVTGMAAKQGLIRHGPSTIQGALRVLGCSEDEDLFIQGAQCKPFWESSHPFFPVQFGETTKNITPEKALRSIFKLLKDIASSQDSSSNCVTITLPTWTNDSTRFKLKRIANDAGFQVSSIISQPAAACLAYQLLDDNKTNFTAVVIHCGNTTSTATLVEVSGGLLSIKESTETSTIAGDSITKVLVQHFAKEFYQKYKGDPMENRRSKMKLYNASETCKHVLSTMTTAQVHVDSLWEGVDMFTNLSRSRFDGLVSSTLSQILQPIRELIEKCDIDVGQISKVILTGGTCKIPKLQSMIQDIFQSAEILARIPADEALAFGAVLEITNTDSPNKSYSSSAMVPALAVPLFCKVLDNKISRCVFNRATPTHSRQSVLLPLDKDCNEFTVQLYEAEEACLDPTEDQTLAQISFSQKSTNLNELKIDFHLKSDGSLTVNFIGENSKVLKSCHIEAGRS